MKEDLEKEYGKIDDMYELSKEFNKVARDYDDLAAKYTDPSIAEKVDSTRPNEEQREERAAKREKIIELRVSKNMSFFVKNIFSLIDLDYAILEMSYHTLYFWPEQRFVIL